jgi:DNA-binding CsgD family transcriptional regulator
VDPRGPAIIDFIEAAYDLQTEPDDWLSALIRAGVPVLDRGLGVFALTLSRPPEPGPVVIDRMHLALGPPGLAERVARLQGELDMRLLWPLTRPGMPKTMSEVTRDHDPVVFQRIMGHFDFAKDGLGLSAFEPCGRGIFLIIPLPNASSLTPRARERWQMLAAHFGAGYRLRRAILSAAGSSASDLPHGAEALIEPTSFRVTEAIGPARSRGALDALRQAAIQVDHARGRMRRTEPERALEIWRALVRGRWSTIDWFDSDGRRYVLGVPNAPEVTDPRGLTDREYQVVTYLSSGQTSKMIGYHLGLSKSRVSRLLRSAMRKVGAQNRAQLIQKLGDFWRSIET